MQAIQTQQSQPPAPDNTQQKEDANSTSNPPSEATTKEESPSEDKDKQELHVPFLRRSNSRRKPRVIKETVFEADADAGQTNNVPETAQQPIVDAPKSSGSSDDAPAPEPVKRVIRRRAPAPKKPKPTAEAPATTSDNDK